MDFFNRQLHGHILPCNGTELKMDEACLHITSSADSILQLYHQSEECYMCKFFLWTEVLPFGNASLVVPATYAQQISVENRGFQCCYNKYAFQEYGHYSWNLHISNCTNITVVQKPEVPYFSILIAFLTLSMMALLWNRLQSFYHSEWMTQLRQRNVPFSELESDLGSPSPTDGPALVRSEMLPTVRRQTARVISLDTFRGICIAVMIFVNYGGGCYWFFKHSPWNGLTVADLVFPWFAWIMGVSLVISLRSQLRSTLRRRHLFLRVLQRSAILVAAGIVLNTLNNKKVLDLENLRIPGVLQRLGLSYLVAGTIETLLIKPQGTFQYGPWLAIQDIFDSWLQWLIVLGLTAVHVAITFLLPVPGCPKGYLGPGGLHQNLSYPNCTGGAAGYIDRLVFGENHIYQQPTCMKIYKTDMPYDPEGLLGTLTSVLMVYLGIQAGRVLLCYHYTVSRAVRWSSWAVFTGLLAGILCNFSKEEGWIPVNKNLWSVSYVLALASMAFVVQTVLYLVVDTQHWWTGSPFVYAGMNPLLLYVGHIATKNVFPWSWQPMYNTHGHHLPMDLWGTGLWLLVAFILFKKNIFLSV